MFFTFLQNYCGILTAAWSHYDFSQNVYLFIFKFMVFKSMRKYVTENIACTLTKEKESRQKKREKKQ